jgi:hypothetical protein
MDSKTMNTMNPLSFETTVYNGYLGLKNTRSKIVSLNILPAKNIQDIVQKLNRLILMLVDNSGSMNSVMDSIVKPLLFALHEKCPNLGETIYWTILRFDNTCDVIYTNLDEKKDFSKAQFKNIIDSALTADGMTNTSAAFRKTFEVCNTHTDIPTWIVHITDGEPTAGTTNIEMLTREIMEPLARNIHTCLTNLGMGSEYNENFLSKLKQLTHVANGDQIIDIIANLVFKISNAITMNTEIIAGNKTTDIGTLTHEDKYVYVHQLNSSDTKVELNIKYTGIDLKQYNEKLTIDTDDKKAIFDAPISIVKDFMLQIINNQLDLFNNSSDKKDSIYGLKGVAELLDLTLFQKYASEAKTSEQKTEVETAETQVRDAISKCQALANEFELSIRIPSYVPDAGLTRGISSQVRAVTQQTNLMRESSAQQTSFRTAIRSATQPNNLTAPPVLPSNRMTRALNLPPSTPQRTTLNIGRSATTNNIGHQSAFAAPRLTRQAASSGAAQSVIQEEDITMLTRSINDTDLSN